MYSQLDDYIIPLFFRYPGLKCIMFVKIFSKNVTILFQHY